MKKLSILTAVMLAALSCFAFSACGGGGTTPSVTPSVTPSQEPSVTPSVEPTGAAGAFSYEIQGEAAVLVDYLGEDKEITLPSTYLGLPVIAVACGVFQGNTALESLTLPDSLIRIEEDAFRDCASLKSVTVSGTPALKTIAANAFDGCSLLKTVSGTANCEKVGSRAFKGCTALEEIDLSSVKDIGASAFEGCTSLKKVFTEYRESVLDEEESEAEKTQGCNRQREIVNTGIGTKAFYGCTSLTAAYFPANSLGFIGESAFEGCTGLQKLYLPNTVIIIRKNAFKDCNSLTTVFHVAGGWSFSEIIIDESAGLDNATVYYRTSQYAEKGWYHNYNYFGEPTLWKE
ncbi:MAG: leucine-rich repeat domain-containing protein [Clostridia bacterium]|nr:leucine-rich repeat domain-containing protein [Clostridia bacterium]